MTIDEARTKRTLARIARDRAHWTLVSTTAEVLKTAGALVAVHPVRTLDAIHVASAQLFAARLATADIIFISADRRQSAVATAIGLTSAFVATTTGGE